MPFTQPILQMTTHYYEVGYERNWVKWIASYGAVDDLSQSFMFLLSFSDISPVLRYVKILSKHF